MFESEFEKRVPEISVVMSVYNGALYIKDAIDSILNQTFTDFEFIIINDGSTDETESIILEYKDCRVKYISQNNTGLGRALRNGCNMSKGRYIARMDADDVSLPNRLETQHAYLEVNPDCVLVSSAVFYIDKKGEMIGRSFPYTYNSSIMNKIKKGGGVICHPAVLMRKYSYLLAGGYEAIEPLEDFYMWMKIARQGKLHNLKTPLLNYRILNNSISRSISTQQYKSLIKGILKIVENKSLNKNEINEFKQQYAKARSVMELNKCNNLGEMFTPNSKIESFIYKLLSIIGVNEKMIESIICNFKNILGLLKVI